MSPRITGSDVTAEDRRLAYWERVIDDSGPARRWRTPGRTRTLILCYFSAVGLLPATLAATLFWSPAIWFYLAAAVAIIVSWTVLRSAIDVKDAVPAALLDEYEQSVLARWRHRSHRLFMGLSLTGGVGVMAIGVVFHEDLTVTLMAVISALTMFMIGLLAGSLPAVGYALTFHRDADEER